MFYQPGPTQVEILGWRCLIGTVVGCFCTCSRVLRRLLLLLDVMQDLYDAISAGDYPEWTLCIQTMDPADQDK
jgi:hypothetical protein